MDNLSPEARRRTMQRVRGQDTTPEMVVRWLVHSLGYRYRSHRDDLPGKPDIVLPGRRAVVFVHGCWWHGHDCKRGSRTTQTKIEYWEQKRERNRRRDRRVQQSLRRQGWRVMVAWECQLRDLNRVARRVRRS